jgi:hypothetical protein
LPDRIFLAIHAQKSAAREFCQRKTPETVAEQYGNLGRNNRHANIDKQQNGCEPREQTDNQERATHDFDSCDEWPTMSGAGMPIFAKRPAPSSPG